ncbi:hypothetical protein CSQ32_004823 [Salmonella enterica subsp. diarizonae]|uniref:Ead/Ea22-like family protein n=1 Tax=Salmonella enterica subsp. diarizonae serovar 48:i:z TaxID=1192842 RepID=A0A735RLG4_SALDZ|nr:hypothetical protein [Salmonella enterica]EBY8872937.1 hypothetical protein [Salmonella enterica subsp. enterica serovar Typhimurium]ECE5796220.1 hypothetical protein [Salmonella enterica subsp. diarizonae]EAT6911781.1 hypothetical protein [Salmonella enterica]EBC8284018.1 hypothetical protein [Salmonella enterica]EBH0779729.1 hypothetical protein [Salmonella enterica]
MKERGITDGLTKNRLAERNAALTAKLSMINDLMEVAEQASKLAQEAAEKLVQERNALAAENVAMKSALNDILQPDAAVLERNHRVRALDAMETPATDAFLAEVRASAIEAFADNQEKIADEELVGGNLDLSLRFRGMARAAKEFAAQIRQEDAQ